jgi:hypothetical protein
MHTAYLIVVILTAAANLYAASNDFTRPAWIVTNMKTLGIEEGWLPALEPVINFVPLFAVG